MTHRSNEVYCNDMFFTEPLGCPKNRQKRKACGQCQTEEMSSTLGEEETRAEE